MVDDHAGMRPTTSRHRKDNAVLFEPDPIDHYQSISTALHGPRTISWHDLAGPLLSIETPIYKVEYLMKAIDADFRFCHG